MVKGDGGAEGCLPCRKHGLQKAVWLLPLLPGLCSNAMVSERPPSTSYLEGSAPSLTFPSQLAHLSGAGTKPPPTLKPRVHPALLGTPPG